MDGVVTERATIGIVPARGGSKRIPRKNLVPIGGRPMIAWTIEAAFQPENGGYRTIVGRDSRGSVTTGNLINNDCDATGTSVVSCELLGSL